MKSGVWIVEYWSALYGRWFPTTHWYLTKRIAEDVKKEFVEFHKGDLTGKKFRVQRYIPRAEPKAKPTPAEWSGKACPKCGASYVARDKFGLYCCVSGCEWKEAGAGDKKS